MRPDEGDQDGRQQQDMQDVEAGDDIRARKFVPEQQVGDPGAGERDRLDHAVDDAQAVAREQVVGERVAREAERHGEHEQQEADDPVELARLAEGAGEEDAQHVQADRGHEQQCRPVMHLAHEQAAPDLERDIEGGVVRHRHRDAVERQVRALVLDLRHRRVEEEGQEGSAQEDDDEAVQRHLAEHERPVVGEDLAPQRLDRRGGARALVNVVGRPPGEPHAARGRGGGGGGGLRDGAHSSRSQKLGPTGSVKSLVAMR